MLEASKKRTMAIRNWKAALNRFMIEFDGRLRTSFKMAVTQKSAHTPDRLQ